MKKTITILLHAGMLPACLAKCYYPSGAEAFGDFPCDPNAESSACCGGKNWGVACLDGNLCLGPTGTIFRGTCSDATWDSPDCPNRCLNMDGVGNLISCKSTTGNEADYCCASDGNNCCESTAKIFQLPSANLQQWATWIDSAKTYSVMRPRATPSSSSTSSSTSSSSSTTSTASSSTTTSSSSSSSSQSSAANTSQQTSSTNNTPAPTGASSSNPPSQTPSAGLSTAAQAGIGVGAAVGALLIAAVIYLWWRLRRTQKLVEAAGGQAARDAQQWADGYYAAKYPGGGEPSGNGNGDGAYMPAGATSVPRHGPVVSPSELSGHWDVGELPGSRPVHPGEERHYSSPVLPRDA